MTGSANNSTSEVVLAPSLSRLDSYLFWKDKARQSDAKFPIRYQDWVDLYGEICQFCDGDRSYTSLADGQKRYCACSMMEWLDQQESANQPYQSPCAEHTLDELIPLHKPMDNGDKRLHSTITYLQDKWLIHPNQWMYIFGGPGSAKTHILQAVRTYLPKGLSIYITAGDFRSKLFAAQAADGAVEALVEALATVPILLFDDWGMEYQKLNDWAGTSFENIIDRRVTFPDWFPTIVTSNLSDDKWRSSSDTGHKRTISRLCDPQYAMTIEFLQADFRDRTVQEAIK